MKHIDDIFESKNDSLYYSIINLLSAVSLLKHDKSLTEDEQKTLRGCIEFSFSCLDKINVSFNFQNALLYIAEKYDSRVYYLRDMILFAVDHAGGVNKIYREA